MENSTCCSDALEKGRLCEQASDSHDLAAFCKNMTDLEEGCKVLLNA